MLGRTASRSRRDHVPPQRQRLDIVLDELLDLVRLPAATGEWLAGNEVDKAFVLEEATTKLAPPPRLGLYHTLHQARNGADAAVIDCSPQRFHKTTFISQREFNRASSH
jgi:hypothetical protein